ARGPTFDRLWSSLVSAGRTLPFRFAAPSPTKSVDDRCAEGSRMPRMSDQPLTVGALAGALATFHREVLRPDIQRIVGDAEGRLRDEMQTFHDSLLTKLDRLETEYAAIKAALARVEERLGRVEERPDRVEARLDTADARFARIETRLGKIEKRLRRVEKRL